MDETIIATEMMANAFNCVFIASLLLLLNVIDIRDPKHSFVRQETTCEFAHFDGGSPPSRGSFVIDVD